MKTQLVHFRYFSNSLIERIIIDSRSFNWIGNSKCECERVPVLMAVKAPNEYPVEKVE